MKKKELIKALSKIEEGIADVKNILSVILLRQNLRMNLLLKKNQLQRVMITHLVGMS